MDKTTYISMNKIIYQLLKNIIIILLFMVSFLFPKEQIFGKENLDTLTNCSKNRMAFVQALGVNGNLWIYNRYIANEHWAKISIQSFKNNIEHGWVIDEDRFDINQVGHPYQGA